MSDNVELISDFSCKVRWEELTFEGGEGSWGERLLGLAMENLMAQWVEEKNRYRGGDTPSRQCRDKEDKHDKRC